MGRFRYGDGIRLDIEDRVLAHLQVVIASKLRRREPFHFTWRDDVSTGGGRTAVWVNPRSALVFTYAQARRPSLNRAWLDALMDAANSPGGLHIVAEPSEDAHSAVDPV